MEQWDISSDGNFQAVDVNDGRYVYFGGHYEMIEGEEAIDRLICHDKATGETACHGFRGSAVFAQ